MISDKSSGGTESLEGIVKISNISANHQKLYFTTTEKASTGVIVGQPSNHTTKQVF